MDQKRILIIDDDPSMIDGLTAVLSPLYAVHGVSDGLAAIAFLKDERTDLVILDLVLGDEDGLDLLPLLRELTHAPVLLLTGFGTRENLLRSIRAKPDDFLDKPVGLRELRSRVASLLQGTGSEGDPLERARTWITRDFHRPLTAKALARSAGMSPSNFRRAFAERFGLTPRAYLEECRMKQAASLLRETDQLIKEVAGLVGCPDANNFSTAFKRYHGLAPEAYRAEHRPSSPIPPRHPS